MREGRKEEMIDRIRKVERGKERRKNEWTDGEKKTWIRKRKGAGIK